MISRPAGANTSERAFHLLLPGELNQKTGGYHYDRRIVEGLRQDGWCVDVHQLDAGFPDPDAAALDHAARIFAGIPDEACVVIDGLALGAIPDLAAAHGTRLKLVGLVHHPLALETGITPAAAARLQASEQRALASTCAVITTSRITARALRDYAVPDDMLTTVAPGTDLPSSTRPAERRCASTKDPLILLCVATLTRRKGHDVLIDALQRIADKPWQLVCVGSDQRDSSWAEGLRARITDAGLTGRIVLTGEISAAELDSRYRCADVFVLASHHEGYGMVFDEAIAYGLPIVTTTAGAIADTVPADAGLLLPPNDSQALASALSSLIESGERVETLRAGAARARATLRSWDDACAEFARVLNHVNSALLPAGAGRNSRS